VKSTTTIAITTLVTILLAVPAAGNGIANFMSPSEVRELVTQAMGEWALKATDPTGCGGGPCCPDTRANEQCTGAGVPQACCTGSTAGTCNLDACNNFARILLRDKIGWAGVVEEELQYDGDWACETWRFDPNSNRSETACTAVNATAIEDVGRICSKIAGLQFSP
jgi:hypothetical protein